MPRKYLNEKNPETGTWQFKEEELVEPDFTPFPTRVCEACGLEFDIQSFGSLGQFVTCKGCRKISREQNRLAREAKPTPVPDPSDEPQLVTCRTCGQVKLLSEFTVDHYRKSGHLPSCKECTNAKRKAHKKTLKNTESGLKVLAHEREYQTAYRKALRKRQRLAKLQQSPVQDDPNRGLIFDAEFTPSMESWL